eukprot:CAMPEP_0181486390 /NCGR_PEP_ID=MMETSP1110-20121109/47128_1 /TAXON_ID=174948 /ORGANISM="Symbiodinium sp., Strain CCMP421" /LENGTH=46 /DNA_ID= /DNA_START= /DNA_END= /DNA_ORIENTATION=
MSSGMSGGHRIFAPQSVLYSSAAFCSSFCAMTAGRQSRPSSPRALE